MRKMIAVVLLAVVGLSSRGDDGYNELIRKVCSSCESPALLLTVSFTNDVIAYRAGCTNIQDQCAADLALAISLMHRMDHDEACAGNDECFRHHQNLVSNIVCCQGIEDGSWIRCAAAAEYMTGLNYGNQQYAAFSLSTNMTARLIGNPPNMGPTNYWKSMSSWMRCPNETLLTVFRLNASVWLAEHDRLDEIISLTNSLPESAIRIFLDETGH